LSEARATGQGRGTFWPVLLLLLAVLAWNGFQTTQLVIERQTLGNVKTTQEAPLEESKKLRAALDSLSTRTQRLADAGNPNAKLLVEQLRQRGITITPNEMKRE